MSGDDCNLPEEQPTVRLDPDARPTVTDLAAGRKVFGRYVLTSVVGRGGMGVVWQANDETLHETVALKFLPEVVARDPAAIDELKQETRRARRLTHAHIVRIHDFVQDEERAAVSMEYVAGRTLSQLRLAQPGKVFSPEALAPLLIQLCAALDYAHQQARIVHRDLKPSNLLVTDDGQLKVTDFGIARSLVETNTRLTGGSGISGTLNYMSPQQLAGERPTAADDIYALGATLYDLLTGKPPFYTGDIWKQVQQMAPKTIAARRAEFGIDGGPVPAAWEQTILACLAKTPGGRPESAGVIAARLQAPLSATPGLTIRPQKSPRAAIVWLAAAALLAAGLAVYFSRSDPPVPGPERPIPVVAAPVVASREFIVTIEPVLADTRIWLGSYRSLPVTGGRAVLKDLPDGENKLFVRARGYQQFSGLAIVKDGRGQADVQLRPVRGSLEISARPDTVVTATDDSGRMTRLGSVPASGLLTSNGVLPTGHYQLRFEHPALVSSAPVPVDLPDDQPVRIAAVQTPVAPDLKSIPVVGYGRPLTNARIESITGNGISFICDQGLREVPFNNLPSAFRTYYGQFIKPVDTVQSAPVNGWNGSSPHVAAPERNAADPETVRGRLLKISSLRQRMAASQRIIDFYLHQGSYRPGGRPVSTEEYGRASQQLEDYRRQLADLGIR